MSTRPNNDFTGIMTAMRAAGVTEKKAVRAATRLVHAQVKTKRGHKTAEELIVARLNRVKAFTLRDYARMLYKYTGQLYTARVAERMLDKLAAAGRVVYAIIGGHVYGSALPQ